MISSALQDSNQKRSDSEFILKVTVAQTILTATVGFLLVGVFWQRSAEAMDNHFKGTAYRLAIWYCLFCPVFTTLAAYSAFLVLSSYQGLENLISNLKQIIKMQKENCLDYHSFPSGNQDYLK